MNAAIKLFFTRFLLFLASTLDNTRLAYMINERLKM